ncbi:methyl-accepting chemotaxis protein, partial [Lichenihabitans sp. Uapishka_5]|nr:methyl-accepting chemotaxis protein [Lichenihabitans sp. Uapishka_5]
NQMDQVTQQNAAMVEQSTASSKTLAQETEALAGLVSRFKVETTGRASTMTQPRPSRATPAALIPRTKAAAPKRAMPAQKMVSNGASVGAAGADEWQEF